MKKIYMYDDRFNDITSRVPTNFIEVFNIINDLTNVKCVVFFEFDTNYRT